MADAPGLKATLKRGALVAAANWPLVAVQFVAESTLKLLLAVPVVGGLFLAVLLLSFASMGITMLFQIWFTLERLRGRPVPHEEVDREATH